MCIIKSGKLCYESKSEKCNMVYKFSHKFHLTAGFFVFVLKYNIYQIGIILYNVTKGVD